MTHFKEAAMFILIIMLLLFALAVYHGQRNI